MDTSTIVENHLISFCYIHSGTIRQIAKDYKKDRSFAARTLQLANLAPDIVKMIWENRHPISLSLDKLRRGIPDSWEEQRKLFL